LSGSLSEGGNGRAGSPVRVLAHEQAMAFDAGLVSQARDLQRLDHFIHSIEDELR
jgi:hypothetical protein